MTDDELERSFVRFIADYHTRPHRGIGSHTPAGMWAKLSKDPQFDMSMLPGPAALREACGDYEKAGVSEEGIRFKNLIYSNEFIRDQRSAKGTERIAKPGDQLNIKVDHLDIGAIAVLTSDDMISVPCIDQTMRGKLTCHGIFPPSAIRVRPMERTDDEEGTTDGRADHWHLAGRGG